MKRKLAAALLAASLTTLIAFVSFIPQSSEAKTAQPATACLGCQLDAAYLLAVGQRGFYQLTDEEGGVDFNQFGQLEPFGRKVPAVLTALEFDRNPDGSLVTSERGGFIAQRGGDGTIVVCVHVLRPANKGGSFDRCDATYGGRGPGGFDIIQPPDLVGY